MMHTGRHGCNSRRRPCSPHTAPPGTSRLCRICLGMVHTHRSKRPAGHGAMPNNGFRGTHLNAPPPEPISARVAATGVTAQNPILAKRRCDRAPSGRIRRRPAQASENGHQQARGQIHKNNNMVGRRAGGAGRLYDSAKGYTLKFLRNGLRQPMHLQQRALRISLYYVKHLKPNTPPIQEPC